MLTYKQQVILQTFMGKFDYLVVIKRYLVVKIVNWSIPNIFTITVACLNVDEIEEGGGAMDRVLDLQSIDRGSIFLSTLITKILKMVFALSLLCAQGK